MNVPAKIAVFLIKTLFNYFNLCFIVIKQMYTYVFKKQISKLFRKCQFVAKNSIINFTFYQFYNDLDAVNEISNKDVSIRNGHNFLGFKVNCRHLLPVAFCLVFFLDTAWQMAGFGWNLAQIPADSTLARKVMPSSLIAQADVFFSDIIAMIFGVAIQFLVHDMADFEIKYRMFAIRHQNGKDLKEMRQNGKGKTEDANLYSSHSFNFEYF